jgi:hypothetical protein
MVGISPAHKLTEAKQMMYTHIKEAGNLYSIGHYDGDGEWWVKESNLTLEEAEQRLPFLNAENSQWPSPTGEGYIKDVLGLSEGDVDFTLNMLVRANVDTLKGEDRAACAIVHSILSADGNFIDRSHPKYHGVVIGFFALLLKMNTLEAVKGFVKKTGVDSIEMIKIAESSIMSSDPFKQGFLLQIPNEILQTFSKVGEELWSVRRGAWITGADAKKIDIVSTKILEIEIEKTRRGLK